MPRYYLVVLVLNSLTSLADPLSDRALYWPFLKNGYTTYHADAYRSDSTPIEPASKYKVAGKRGPDNMVWVANTLDYDLGLSYFPTLGRPKESKIYSYFETGSRTGQLKWSSESLGVSVDNCALPYSQTIDVDHNIYFSDCRYIYSATPNGKLRWRTPLPKEGLQIPNFYEVFFTGKGDVGGVSNFGILALYDRATGRQKLSYQLPNASQSKSPYGSAFVNAPASMLDPVRPGVTRVYEVGQMNSDGDGDGVKDIGLYRVDISYSTSGVPSAKTVFTAVVPNGDTSNATPTLSPDGTEIYISDSHHMKLYAVSTETGAFLWSVNSGLTTGSMSVSRNLDNLVFSADFKGRLLRIIDPSKPSAMKSISYQSVAERHIPAKTDIKRNALVSTNILATPSQLMFVLTLGYETGTATEQGLLWPVKALFVTTDHSGNLLSEVEIPTTSDVAPTILPDKTVFIPAADVQAKIAAAQLFSNPEKYSIYGPALKPVGGLYVLKPTQ